MTNTEQWEEIKEIKELSKRWKCSIITATQLINKDYERSYTKRVHMGSSDGVEDFMIIDYVDRLD